MKKPQGYTWSSSRAHGNKEKDSLLSHDCYLEEEVAMRNEFTAIIEKDENWYIAYCAEIPGANGQGKTKEECLKSLAEAIELILEDKRQDSLRGISEDAISELVTIG